MATVTLTKSRLDVPFDPAPNFYGLGFNPWGAMNRIWLESTSLIELCHADTQLSDSRALMAGSPKKTLHVARGGLCNSELSRSTKDVFKKVLEYVCREYPEIPEKPTGDFVLHGDRAELQKVEFVSK